MIKENVKVKKSLSEADKISMTSFLFNGYFLFNEDGEILYTPYFREINNRTAFFLYAVEGLTFEDQKDEEGNTITDEAGEAVAESIYDCSFSDSELNGLYDSVFSSQDNIYAPLRSELIQIDIDVKDMVEFKKQQVIHAKKDSLSELLAMFISKMNPNNLEALAKNLDFSDSFTKQD